MHARVFWKTDARNQTGYCDGCTKRMFGQQIRARYGANPGCAQPTMTPQMRATSLTSAVAHSLAGAVAGSALAPAPGAGVFSL